MMPLVIRATCPEDLAACRDCYRAAAFQVAIDDYSAEQKAAWAAFADSDEFEAYATQEAGLVAERDKQVAGFTSWQTDGYVRTLYVHPRFQRRGVGAALLTDVLAAIGAQTDCTVHASPASCELFARFGFEVVSPDQGEYGGLLFRRYFMRRVKGHFNNDA